MHAEDIDSFFYVRSWLAVQTDDHEELARVLGAADRRVCTFDEYAAVVSGPRTDRDEGFFVCEPVDGWTLVFGEVIGLGVPAEVKAKKFAQVETIKRFSILPRGFTIEDGELTPTLKIKRRNVSQNFAREIEAMYAE